MLVLFGSCVPAPPFLLRRTPFTALSPCIISRSSKLGFLSKSRGTKKDESPIDVDAKFKDLIEEPVNGVEGSGPHSYNYGDDISDSDSDMRFEESMYSEQKGENSFDKNPEFADILGSFLSDPQKGQSKMEERLRKKRHKILHSKTGSPTPMKVTFNKFNFSNSYIWFEFYNTLLEKDVSLICNAIRSWHIIGRLGGCNSMNMQLSQATFDKRPGYDYIQGANVTPTTFYNIGDFEIQDNLARIWVDIGTREPLLLDVLVNALTQISSDFVGIKHVAFGGKEFTGWNDNLKSEDTGYVTFKI